MKLVQSSVKNKPEASALFFDELSKIVESENLDEKVLVSLGIKVTGYFFVRINV